LDRKIDSEEERTMSHPEKKERVSDPEATSRDADKGKSDEVVIKQTSPANVTRRVSSETEKAAAAPPKKNTESDEEDGSAATGSTSKLKKGAGGQDCAKSIKTLIQDKISGKDKKEKEKKEIEEAKDKEEKEGLVDEEKGKKGPAKGDKGESKGQSSGAAVNTTNIMQSMKQKFQAIGEGVRSRVP
jgi:hypothetical protein